MQLLPLAPQKSALAIRRQVVQVLPLQERSQLPDCWKVAAATRLALPEVNWLMDRRRFASEAAP